MASSKNSIRIEFFDADNKQMIGYDEQPLKALPEDFDVPTWVEISGNKYKMVKFLPEKRKELKKTKLLTIHLKLEEAAENPTPSPVVKASLFKSPSKADYAPRFAGEKAGKKTLDLAAFEWRGIEFVHHSFREDVEQCFEKIEEIVLSASTMQDGKTFFRRQHVRSEVVLPLRGRGLKVEGLKKDFFPFANSLAGLSFMGESGLADFGFAFRTPAGFTLYGLEVEDNVRYLAVQRPAEMMPEMVKTDAAKVYRMMRSKMLLMVDWEALQIIEAEEDAVRDFFLDGYAEDRESEGESESEERVSGSVSEEGLGLDNEEVVAVSVAKAEGKEADPEVISIETAAVEPELIAENQAESVVLEENQAEPVAEIESPKAEDAAEEVLDLVAEVQDTEDKKLEEEE